MRDEYWIKKRMQHLFHRVTGQRVMSFERPHHGISDVLDIIRTGLPVGTIIDVEANTGQSALRFRAAFPRSRIISLEPVNAMFEELNERVAGLDVETFRVAMGRERGSSRIYLTDFSLTNSLIEPPEGEVRGVETVDVDTLDNFLRRLDIERVGTS